MIRWQLLITDFEINSCAIFKYWWELVPTLTLSVSSCHIFSGPTFSLQFTMVFRNLCERLYSKIIFGKSRYEGGKKYCRRCEVYFYHNGVFCPSCGMALRTTATARRDKEKLKQSQHLRLLLQRLVNE